MGKSVLEMFTRKPFRLLFPVGAKPQLSAHLNVQTRQNTRPPQLDEDVWPEMVHSKRLQYCRFGFRSSISQTSFGGSATTTGQKRPTSISHFVHCHNARFVSALMPHPVRMSEIVHLYRTHNCCSEPGVSTSTTPANVRQEWALGNRIT